MSTTTEQRHTALEHATEVRLARPRLRREMKTGQLSLAAALTHPALSSMRVWELLCLLPRRGPARPSVGRQISRSEQTANWLFSLLDRNGPLTQARDLTERERNLLVAAWESRQTRAVEEGNGDG